ncbi:MAG TPA: DMT family transporter [Terriglobales bacterium]|nr:DMT family transporter [Terriglobales bacterium]
MPLPSQLAPTAYGLISIFCWGVSDFLGGCASRRSNPFLITTLAHASGLVLMLAIALAMHAPFPSRSSGLWAIAAGSLGGLGLALFYKALSTGSMGLTAPVAAVLGAAIPTIFAMFVQGVPGPITLAGFLLAATGIWLISRQEGPQGPPEGLALALLAGCGFAGFFICISRTGSSSAIWSSAESRIASFVLVALIVVFAGGSKKLERLGAQWALLAGCLDATGTFFFIRADQTGRLDSAVVLTSLYPMITVLLARIVMKEHFTRWKAVGIAAALVAVPLIAAQ